MASQAGILAPVPAHARYLTFRLRPDTRPDDIASVIGDLDGDRVVVGLGSSLIQALGRDVAGLRAFPRHAEHAVTVPSTPQALWCWLRGDDPGVLLHQSREIIERAKSCFELSENTTSFMYDGGRDLSGYVDGTENPTGEDAQAAALVATGGPGLEGSSFVAVQRWVHDLDHFESLPGEERDHVIGRTRADDVELEDAPASAHVKRTAQEDFDPEAFVVRRSMPWSNEREAGLIFVAFGHSFDAFEALLRRMVGMDDGIVDALFRFTRPVTGAYFWCPPVKDARLDLSALGL